MSIHQLIALLRSGDALADELLLLAEINEKAKAATNYHGKVIIVDSRCFQVTSSGFRELDELT